MGNSWSNTSVTTLVIPTGATTGARVIIDGTTGLISIYNSTNELVDEIGGPDGSIISFATGFSTDVGLREGKILFGLGPTFTNAGFLYGDLITGGGLVLSTGTGDADHVDALELIYRAGRNAQTTGSAFAPGLTVCDINLSSPADLLVTGSVLKAEVGTKTAYTWQSPSYAPNWSGATSFSGLGGPTLKIRHMAEDDVLVYGLATTAAGAGTTAFTLPAGYYPANVAGNGVTGTVMRNRGGTLSVAPLAVDLTNGNLIVGPPPAAGDEYSFNVRIPLQNVP